MKKYDLNIEKILEDWKVEDAIREIIANAIDEQKITGTQSVEIRNQDGEWTIRDFGRGLNIDNFAQSESVEKRKFDGTIGKFGIGLKDAISVLFRKKIDFKIQTKNFVAYPQMHRKDGFDISTIHMIIEEVEGEFSGTKFIFKNLKDKSIEAAKENFLIFNSQKLLKENNYGQMFDSETSMIYVNGMKIAESKEYLFSYNLTKINAKMSSKMNRERKSIGKEAYSGLVEKILGDDISIDIASKLFDQPDSGEMQKKKIRNVVFTMVNTTGQYVFMTEEQIKRMNPEEMEVFKALGKKIHIIKDNDKTMLSSLYNTRDAFDEYNDSFEFDFVAIDKLTDLQKQSYGLCVETLKKLNRRMKLEIVKKNNSLNEDVFGYWTANDKNKIFIVAQVLFDKSESIKTLIHEYAHSLNDAYDSTREFENDLGDAWFKYSSLN